MSLITFQVSYITTTNTAATNNDITVTNDSSSSSSSSSGSSGIASSGGAGSASASSSGSSVRIITGTVVEEGVRADRLRLWVDLDDNVVDSEGHILVPKSAHNAADIAAGKQSLKDAKKAKKALAEAAAVKVTLFSYNH